MTAGAPGPDAAIGLTATREVWLLPRAARALEAIERLQRDRQSWIGTREALLHEIARDGGVAMSQRVLTDALSDLEHAELIARGRLGRELQLKRTAPAGGAFVVRLVGELDGRDIVRAAGSGRLARAGTPPPLLNRRRQDAAIETSPSMSSSSSSTAAAAIDQDAANARAHAAATRLSAAGTTHAAIAAALCNLDVDPEPDAVEMIAALRPDETAIFWDHMRQWGRGKPASYIAPTVETAIRKANPPAPSRVDNARARVHPPVHGPRARPATRTVGYGEAARIVVRSVWGAIVVLAITIGRRSR